MTAPAAAARQGRLAVLANRGLLARAALWRAARAAGPAGARARPAGHRRQAVGRPRSRRPGCRRARGRSCDLRGRRPVYGVSPFLLMAVHENETDFSSSTLPGVRSGVNFAGCCAGPMQFSITGGASPRRRGGGTWAGYRHAYRARLARPASYPLRVRAPHPNVYDSYDAIYAAASYFHALGAGPRLDQRTYQALLSYKGMPPASIPYARHDYERALELEAMAAQARPGRSAARRCAARPARLAAARAGGAAVRDALGTDARRRSTSPCRPATPIYAAAAGRVTTKGWVGGYGNYTCLDHGRQISTCYAHQSSFGPTPSGGLLGPRPAGRLGRLHRPLLRRPPALRAALAGRPIDPLPHLQAAEMTRRRQRAAVLLAGARAGRLPGPLHTTGTTDRRRLAPATSAAPGRPAAGDELPPPAPSAAGGAAPSRAGARGAAPARAGGLLLAVGQLELAHDRPPAARLARLAAGRLADELAAQAARRGRPGAAARPARVRGQLVAVDLDAAGARAGGLRDPRAEIQHGRGELAGGATASTSPRSSARAQGWGVSRWEPQP